MSSYRSDQACSCLHCAQASIPYFHRQDLGTRGHAVSLWLLGEVPCCYAGDVSPVSTCKAKNSLMKKVLIKTALLYHTLLIMQESMKVKPLLNNKTDQEPKKCMWLSDDHDALYRRQ